MTDIYDRAAEQEQQDRDRALQAHARQAQSTATVIESAEFCKDCGDDIPLKRRKAVPGCQRCTTCQARLEKWGRA